MANVAACRCHPLHRLTPALPPAPPSLPPSPPPPSPAPLAPPPLPPRLAAWRAAAVLTFSCAALLFLPCCLAARICFSYFSYALLTW